MTKRGTSFQINACKAARAVLHTQNIQLNPTQCLWKPTPILILIFLLGCAQLVSNLRSVLESEFD